jgi:hypothetical protein
MGLLEGFLYGVFGGFLAELLGLFKLRHATGDSFPEWLKSRFYWMVTILMILAGGVLVVVYLKSKFTLSALIAVNIGASAPLIIGTLVAQKPDVHRARID